jgi:hypothetical protein
MLRRLYLASLLLLQVVLVVRIAPLWAPVVGIAHTAAAAQDGWLAVAELAGAAVALGGSAVALAGPSVALLRHRQRGPLRFAGVPRGGAAAAILGAAVFLGASAPWWMARFLPVEWRVDVLLAAEPWAGAGVALMAAGAAGAELLRRGMPPLGGALAIAPADGGRLPYRPGIAPRAT